MEDNWGCNDYFGITSMWRRALHDGYLNRPWVAFVVDLAAVASAETLAVRAAVVPLAAVSESHLLLLPEGVFEVGGVHRVANDLSRTRLLCTGHLRRVFLALTFFGFDSIFGV